MIEIVSGGSSDLEGLRDLWLELHHHHLRIATYPTPTHDDQSWQVRRIDYRAALVENAAFLLIARDGSVPVGYAMTLLHAGGPNDTFVLGPRYAELYTLVVTSDRRGTGIGNELFGAVERELENRAIGDLEIGVMANNFDAVAFYERRGARPVETMLWKFASAGPAPRTAPRTQTADRRPAAGALVGIDDEGTITTWSGAAETWFGYSSAEAVGCDIEMIVPIEYRQRHRDGLRAIHAMAGGPRSADAKPFHLPVLCRNGSVAVFATRFVFLDAPNGQTIGAMVILQPPETQA